MVVVVVVVVFAIVTAASLSLLPNLWEQNKILIFYEAVPFNAA
ncbi:hypothetical protein [Plesiomonas shigelloides]|nr:hypothetical protein [Plesiomonas shigelloides]